LFLFAPAARLVGRLRYAQKFVVVGLVLMVPLGFVAGAYVDLQRHMVAFSSAELQGIEYMTPLVNLTARVVEERHRSVTAPNQPQLNLDSDLDAVDRVNRRYGDLLQANDDWRVARALVVTADASTANADVRFREYNTAVDSLLGLIILIGDHSNLTLDPDLDTYYLMDTLQFRLPLVLDTAGRAVDRIATGRSSPEDETTDILIDLGLYNGVLTNARTLTAHAVQTVAATTADPAVRSLITAHFADFDRSISELSDGLNTALRTRNLADFTPGAGANLREIVVAFADSASNSLWNLLQARIDRYNQKAHDIEITAALVGVVAVYLFVGFYLSVSRPIRRIVDTLHAVGAGDLDRRVSVDTRDELNFIAEALNSSIAQTKVVTERLAIQATYDTLTSLPNRQLALDRLKQALLRTQRGATPLTAVYFIDLDRFKVVNDSFGHEMGDEVLCTVAERLRHLVRGSDTVARLAGDEFVAVCEDTGTVQAAVELGERVIAELSKPMYTKSGRPVMIGASIGVCFATAGHTFTPDDVLRDADLAMYRAKQRGRGRVEIFDEELRASVEHRLHTEDELRVALATGQLRVYYQPMLSAETRRPVGFEALARWQHPSRGLLLPAEFIDVAEESGLITQLGAQVLEAACRQAVEWRAQPGFEQLRIAVNVSAAQFEHGSLPATLARVLDETGLDPSALWLELTERSILNDLDAVRATLADVRRLGVHLAIDDFGTGYSSLTHLRRFPVEALKVDRSFVAGLGQDPENDAIVAMILGLAKTLGLGCVAEGVEDERQFALLRQLGCTEVQGFLFGKPVPAAEALPATLAITLGG
jgi:diguanylate cyclase (GGDEF)-like protein